LTPSGLPIIMNSTVETSPIMTLDPAQSPRSTAPAIKGEKLRSAMRAWTAGVTIVTAAYNGSRHGMTVNSFASISLDPPWITISLQQAARTHELVLKTGAFGITILSAEQKDLSDRFAGRTPAQSPRSAASAVQGESEDRFKGLVIESLVTGAPFIKGGRAYLDCRLVQTISAGMNTLFIGEVVAALAAGQDQPLIYHIRKYWRLSDI
jgi:flavin reductase (DIM6/NTAB) family NADH-FMN oxidoreductase RutF